MYYTNKRHIKYFSLQQYNIDDEMFILLFARVVGDYKWIYYYIVNVNDSNFNWALIIKLCFNPRLGVYTNLFAESITRALNIKKIMLKQQP